MDYARDVLPLLDGQLSDYLKEKLQYGMDLGYNFVRSSAKSSHSRKAVETLDDCLDELTNASIITQLKRGDLHIIMRKYINLRSEYRCYIHKGKLTYMEEYLDKTPALNKSETAYKVQKEQLIEYITQEVMPKLHDKYESYTVDIGEEFFQNSITLIVIEINTPIGCLAGLSLCNYRFKQDEIENTDPTQEAHLYYKDIDGDIAYV
jgi:hypothetical protein